ncbi:MAG: trypsin-like peptidase domain-containing protein [Actinomycetales bacterium]|nr:trypsin-like peptidase domain-containing protein [Actinomycetales bacterium]
MPPAAYPPAANPPGANPPAAYPPVAPPVRTTPGKGGARRIGELAVVALLSAGLASGGTYAVVRTIATAPGSATTTTAPAAAVAAPVVQADADTPDWTATAAAVAPSVVAIKVVSGQGEGEGSGVIIDSAGRIITNNHVVTGAGTGAQISVTLDDGRTYAATIAGTDPSTDLAVLTLTNPPSDLRPISFGDSDALAVGQPVMAVGNPLGLAGTVTTGIVSALNRPVSTGSSDTGVRGQAASDPVVTNAIQTSAAINPGNSGGALVTADGRLVGINSAIASLGTSAGGQSGNIGIGFAIPSSEAKAIAAQLIATGSAQHAYLGVSSADALVADGGAQRAAAVLRAVSAGTPAAQAGLRVGDAVVAIGGERVDSSLALVAAIREQSVGSHVTLTIVRDGSRQDIAVTLVARPAN